MICRKWPIFAIRDQVRDRVFFDRDRLIVDREMQGPSYFNIMGLSHDEICGQMQIAREGCACWLSYL